MDFWDGTEHAFMMPSITAEELADAEHDLVFLCFPERTAIWDVVAGYIQERLLQDKGVRIPTLGSFDIVPTQIKVGDEAVTIQRPMFYLARNLVAEHNLTDDKDYLPGHKELQPLKYSKVATAASVSRRKAEICIQGTIAFLSVCLGKGNNIALVLKDIGVLVIERKKVQIKFFCDFLETMSGKENWKKAVSKVPRLLDMVVSRDVPLGSLTDSGHVITFPEFARQFVPKPPRRPLRHCGRVPGEDSWKHRRMLRALRQDAKGAFDELPSPTASSLSHIEMSKLWEKKNMVAQKSRPR
ncbi:coiled-coil domain-containing protein 81-like [Cuculus canorus]|uniref:coiled-coil domain-containing protein 81-like n=1 Tax=Cuculus canorus TaxID=55661 RepID=UPI0023AA7F5C|nr:coiled-coil domain-containing protein 81-like [Cuculus canorus]